MDQELKKEFQADLAEFHLRQENFIKKKSV